MYSRVALRNRLVTAAIVTIACATMLTECAGSPARPEIWHVSPSTHVDHTRRVIGNYRRASCGSQNFCEVITVDDATYVYDGSSWSSSGVLPNARPSPVFVVMSCIPSRYCLAMSSDNSERYWIYEHEHWHFGGTLDDLGLVYSVSCSTPVFCAAVGTNGIVEDFNGYSWRVAHIVSTSVVMFSVSCVRDSVCVAVGSNAVVLEYDAAHWHYYRYGNWNEGWTSVSCSSRSMCVAVGGGLRGGELLTFDSAKAGTGKGKLHRMSQVLYSISCPSSMACVGTGATNTISEFNNDNWKMPFTFKVSYRHISYIECETPKFCLVY